MPQLDIYSFSSQIFWLTLLYLISFFLCLKYILPTGLAINRMRHYIISSLKVQSLNDSKAIELRDDVLSTLFSSLDLTLSFDPLLRNNINIIKSNRVIDSFNKRDIRSSLIQLVTPFFILFTPNDNFILFLAFFLVLIFILIFILTSNIEFPWEEKIKELDIIVYGTLLNQISRIDNYITSLQSSTDLCSEVHNLLKVKIAHIVTISSTIPQLNISNLPVDQSLSTKTILLTFFQVRKISSHN